MITKVGFTNWKCKYFDSVEGGVSFGDLEGDGYFRSQKEIFDY